MTQPSDSDPFVDLEFDLIDEDSVSDDEPKAAAVPPPRRSREDGQSDEGPERHGLLQGSAEPVAVAIDDAEIFSRDTAIPSLPPDEFAAVSMRDLEPSNANRNTASIDTVPPPGSSIAPPCPSIAPLSADLEFADFGHPADAFGQALPGAFPPPPPPRPMSSEAPTAPPDGPLPEPDFSGLLDDTIRNPVFVENARLEMAEIPDSGQRSSPLRFVDSHARFVDSLSPVAGLDTGSIPTPSPPGGSTREMQEAYDLGDYTHALEIAETLLDAQPNNAEAVKIAQESRAVLTQMLAARVGPLDQVMKVVVSPEEMQWLALDHRSGFLLSLIDGQSTVDEILDISGMTRHDALKIILELTRQQVVQLS